MCVILLNNIKGRTEVAVSWERRSLIYCWWKWNVVQCQCKSVFECLITQFTKELRQMNIRKEIIDLVSSLRIVYASLYFFSAWWTKIKRPRQYWWWYKPTYIWVKSPVQDKNNSLTKQLYPLNISYINTVARLKVYSLVRVKFYCHHTNNKSETQWQWWPKILVLGYWKILFSCFKKELRNV